MKIKSDFEVIDHSVSGEKFQLQYDPALDLFKTVPQPSPEKLPKYYESEEYISHTDRSDGFLEIIYKQVREFSIKRKLALINRSSSANKSILDFGCGTGDFLAAAKLKGWNITGVEPNPGARKIANSKTNSQILDSNQFWELEQKQFDVITLWHVLEHLPDLDKYIEAFRDRLKDDGTLIIAVPNFQSYDAQYYRAYWAAFDVPRHLWHFSREAIKKVFYNHHFHLDSVKPMIFDSFYVSLLSERYKNGSNNFVKAMAVGLLSNLKAMSSGEYSSLIYILKHGKNPK